MILVGKSKLGFVNNCPEMRTCYLNTTAECEASYSKQS